MNKIELTDEQLRNTIYQLTNAVNQWADINKGLNNSTHIDESNAETNVIINYLYDIAHKNHVQVFGLMWDGHKWLTGYEHEGR